MNIGFSEILVRGGGLARTDSGSCPTVDYGKSSIRPLGSTTTEVGKGIFL
jgi:hypothetical protein